MGKNYTTEAACLGSGGLRAECGLPCQWEGWPAKLASPQSQEGPREGVQMGWRWSPTKHSQREQQVLPQLVTQAQPQMPWLRLLRAEVAVVHPHFHLLGHVGTEPPPFAGAAGHGRLG